MRPDSDAYLPEPSDADGPAPDVLAGLTASQRLAVVTDASPLCVIAGAGSGKTRVLTRRVARRVLDGSAAAEHSVVVTFTRKAASELRRRLVHLGVEGVAVGTFHGIALAELRRHWADTGRAPPAVVDDPARILARVAGDVVTGPGSEGRARALASEIEWAQARGLEPAAYSAAARAERRRAPLPPDAVADLYDRYVRMKESRHVVDLHDVVSGAARLIETDPVVADAVRWRVRHLYVDELQDVNPVQWRLVRALLGDRRDLCAVGDPDQAIYSWNGADPTLMARLGELLPGTTTLRLDDNHRSSPQILAVAHAVLGAPLGDAPDGSGDTGPGAAGPRSAPPDDRPGMPPPATRPDGPPPAVRSFDDEESEAAAVVRWLRLAHHPGRPWSHLAVLARTRARLVAVAEALARAGIPARDLSVPDHPAPPRGRPATAGYLQRDAGTRSTRAGAPPAGSGTRMAGSGAPPAGSGTRLAGAGAGSAGLAARPAQATARPAGPSLRPSDAGAETAGATRGGPDGTGAGAIGPDGAGAVPDDGIQAGAPSPPPVRDAVELATFHRAKGLEWPVVALVGLEDGVVPIVHARSAAALAEERRLLYVAVTRAESELWCSWARQRRGGAATRTAAPSPWLAAVQAASATVPVAPAEVARDHLRALRGQLASGQPDDAPS